MTLATEMVSATTYTRWLAKCLNNERTKIVYRNAVATFLHNVYGSDEAPEILVPRYISEVKAGQRNYFDDFVDYVDAANGKTPPNTISTTLAGVKSFMTWCSDVELTTRQQAQLKSKRARGSAGAETDQAQEVIGLAEDLLSPAREIDDLLTSHIIEDELGLFFVQPRPLRKALRKSLPPEPPHHQPAIEGPDDELTSEEHNDEPEVPPEREELKLPAPPAPQRTEVIMREVLRVPCRYCRTLVDPIQSSKRPSCGGRPI